MKTEFSQHWKSSVQPRKQRKYRFTAPLHVKQKMVHVHLVRELRQKYGRRNVQARKGDKVIILRGRFRKREGKVERIDLKRSHIFVSSIEQIKKDGTKIPLALHPSSLMIKELDLTDKRRQEVLSMKKSQSPKHSCAANIVSK